METQNTAFFYTHHPQPPSSAFFSTQNPDKEPMFEKALTPSDVGKLNRLVIPKHHAEKYFPIGGGGGGAGHQQKGLLLNFEDESGKLWRFRYSYWNSSQSYVFTRGWMRYIREKRLDAGDVVFFNRGVLDCERMFIGCRRHDQSVSAVPFNVGTAAPAVNGGGQISRWGNMVQSCYPSHHLPISIPLPYQQPDCLHADAGDVYENAVDYRKGVVATRRLRLFGVNLECPDNSTAHASVGSSHNGQPDQQCQQLWLHPGPT